MSSPDRGAFQRAGSSRPCYPPGVSADAAESHPDPVPDASEPAPVPERAPEPGSDPAPAAPSSDAYADASPAGLAPGSEPVPPTEPGPPTEPVPPTEPGPPSAPGGPATPSAEPALATSPPVPPPAAAPLLDGPPVPPSAILKMALGFYGVVAVFACGYALFSGGLGTLFGEDGPMLPGLLAGLGLGVALVLLSRVGARGWPPMQRMSDTLADLLGPLPWRYAIALALLSGVAEELLFRGALWPHLGLPGTTLLFGLVHVLPRRSLWIYPLFATLAGLLFGLLREGTQSLWPCILAHVTVNALNLVWIGSIAKKRSTGAA